MFLHLSCILHLQTVIVLLNVAYLNSGRAGLIPRLDRLLVVPGLFFALEDTMDNETLKGRSYEIVKSILGDNLITPLEVAKVYNISYSFKQIRYFAETIPLAEDLLWCRDNNAILVAGPHKPMSLLDLRELNPELFCNGSGGWYGDYDERFSRYDKTAINWLMLRKIPVPGSIHKTWLEQCRLISSKERIPNIAETVWGIITYKKLRGVALLPTFFVRTSSVSSQGDHVHAGGFSIGGLYVDSVEDKNKNVKLGILTAR
jgi:hypothetical protein